MLKGKIFKTVLALAIIVLGVIYFSEPAMEPTRNKTCFVVGLEGGDLVTKTYWIETEYDQFEIEYHDQTYWLIAMDSEGKKEPKKIMSNVLTYDIVNCK